MKNYKWLLLLLIVIAISIWLWYTGRLGEDAKRVDLVDYATTQGALAGTPLLVDLRNDANDEQVRSLEKKYGLALRPNSRFSLPERLYRTAVRARQDLGTLLAKLRAEPAVEHAELDEIYGIPPLENEATRFAVGSAAQAGFPNDPKYRFQWHLDQIQMPAAWPKATGRGVVVAVIDTGVAYRDRGEFKRVPDLAQTEFVPGYDFVNKHEWPLDDHGHGTHVAGTIAQSTNNKIGVAGVAYRAKIMPLKVLSARGYGSVADIAEAIRFAAKGGAKVINMSLGGSRPSKILGDAVKYAHDRGVTVVCAAGNEGRGRVGYPAAYPGAIAVAATQYDRTTTFYSNWGKEIDLAAPGGNTRVDQNGDGMPDGVLQNTILLGRPSENDYLVFMGTSMASPHVAGVAALVIESGVSRPDAVERVLKATANHPAGKRDDHYGAGIVDANAAVKKAQTGLGGYRLGLASLLGLLLVVRLRERGRLGIRPGLGLGTGLLFGSAGLFFLPRFTTDGSALGFVQSLVGQGFPAWDNVLLGASGQGNLIFASALVPLLLCLMFYSVTRLRTLLCGFTLGVAAHLICAALLNTTDIALLPNLFCLDQIWLLGNGLGCLGIANLVARK